MLTLILSLNRVSRAADKLLIGQSCVDAEQKVNLRSKNFNKLLRFWLQTALEGKPIGLIATTIFYMMLLPREYWRILDDQALASSFNLAPPRALPLPPLPSTTCFNFSTSCVSPVELTGGRGGQRGGGGA